MRIAIAGGSAAGLFAALLLARAMQPHLIMARCRQLLIERLPDVYAGMLAAGVAEATLRTQMPDTLADTAPRPGDEGSCSLPSPALAGRGFRWRAVPGA